MILYKTNKLNINIMNATQIEKDILKMEKALKLIEKTDCYMLFNKANVIFEICESIAKLKDKLYFQHTRLKTN